MAKSKVRIEVGRATSRLVGEVPIQLRVSLWKKFSYRIDGYQFSPKFKKTKWDGYKRLFHKTHMVFPSGLLKPVSKFIKKSGYKVVLQEKEYPKAGHHLLTRPQGIDRRDYQVDAAEIAVTEKRITLQMATGSGKTVVAGYIMAKIRQPTIFLVHTKDLLQQAIEMFSSMFGDHTVGQIGDGKVHISRITVCTVQTACRAFDIDYDPSSSPDDYWDDADTTDIETVRKALESAGVIIVDECHRTAAPSILRLLNQIKQAEYRIGLSASPWRDDGADLEIYGALGPIGYRITASELYRMGHLVKPVIRILDVPIRTYAKAIQYPKVYSDYVINNATRNLEGAKAAMKMIRRGLPTLILVKLLKHGDILQKLFSDHFQYEVPFINGRCTMEERTQAISDMRFGSLPMMIASGIADEGLDIKPLAGLVLMGGGKSSTKALQRIGRVLRTFEGKEYAEVVDFNDQCHYLHKHSVARQKIYETEDEWDILDF